MGDILMFEIVTDYYVPVLRILADMPAGTGRKQEVLAELERRYGARIPPEHRGTIAWDGRVSDLGPLCKLRTPRYGSCRVHG